VVPALYADIGLIPDAGSMPKQLRTMIDYAVTECSYADVGDEPNAESVYYVLSGPRHVAKAEYGMHVKEALDKFIAPGAAITPCYVQYLDSDPKTNLLLLLGLPKIPELVQIINEATQLVNLHSGASPLKQGWFMRSKGTTRKELVDAINDFRELFSYYMTPGDTME
jgi:hypothetical protein